MSLPSLPPVPENPPAIIRPAPIASDTTSTAITLAPSTSSSDLKQTNSNESNSNSTAVVENTNVNVITQTAPNVAVGDIYYQAPHAYINGYANGNDYGIVVGVQVPLGGGKVRKAAGELAKLRVANYKLSTCAAVANMSIEAVSAIAPEYAVCAAKAKAKAHDFPKYDDELAQLRAELAEARLRLAELRNIKPLPQEAEPAAAPVRGLW